jgi:hypothetical protein
MNLLENTEYNQMEEIGINFQSIITQNTNEISAENRK